MVQKLARYPSINAFFSPSPPFSLSSLTTVEITCNTAMLNALPNCAEVLNTAPANACVSSGNTFVMTINPTVKSASALIGCRSCATKAFAQYVWVGSMTAMRSGERAQKKEVMVTIQ